jgi:hypothetical protein
VSHSNAAQSPETRTQETRTFIRQVRAASRRICAPEEKISVLSWKVLAGGGRQRPLPTRGYSTRNPLRLEQSPFGELSNCLECQEVLAIGCQGV